MTKENDILKDIESGLLTITGRTKVTREPPFQDMPREISSEVSSIVNELKRAWK